MSHTLSEPALALLIDYIVRDVAELPDRTSPPDDPDAMLVTHSELRDILWRRLLEKPAPFIDAEAGLTDAEIATAKELVRLKPSTSYLQRKMQISYDRASRIMARLEADGIISARDNTGARRLVSSQDSRK